MNESEFASCYGEYRKRLFLIAYRLSGSADEAEDIVQEAFAAAYSAWDSFRKRSSRYTWLCRITIRRAYRHMKKTQGSLKRHGWLARHGMTEREFLESIPSGQDIETETITGEIREICLQTFITCLPKKQRAIFTLRLIAEFSVRETAQILEISEEAVKTGLFRAKRTIRDIVENRCDLFDETNPCSCWKWAKRLAEGKSRLAVCPLSARAENHADLRATLAGEADFLRKLTSLYSEGERRIEDSRPATVIRDIIESDTFALLS